MRKIFLGSLGAGLIMLMSASQSLAFGGGVVFRTRGRLIRPFSFPIVTVREHHQEEETTEEHTSIHRESRRSRSRRTRQFDYRSRCSDGEVEVSVSGEGDSSVSADENSSCWIRVSQ